MVKLGNEEIAHEIGHFDLLPEEVFESVLNMIHDLKFLCRSTLVSKGFASKIYRIKTVSVCLPSIDIESKEANWNMDHIFQRMAQFEGDATTHRLQSSNSHQHLKVITFLENFEELESVYLEFACPGSPCTSPLLKWRAKLGNHEPVIESLVSILPTSICEEDEYESDQDQEYHSDIFFFQYSPGKDCLLFPLTCCTEWLVLVCSLIKRHHSIRSMICTDFDRHGTFILKEEQIIAWRKSLLRGESSNDLIPRTVDMGWVPGLHLPVAGYWMKDVFFVFMKFLLQPGAVNAQELDDLMLYEYDSEETVLGEAVREILMNHMSIIIWEFNPW